MDTNILTKYMFKVITKGHFGLFKLLVEKGADICARDERGRTPLFVALEERGNTLGQANEDMCQIVKYLIRNKACKHLTDEERRQLYSKHILSNCCERRQNCNCEAQIERNVSENKSKSCFQIYTSVLSQGCNLCKPSATTNLGLSEIESKRLNGSPRKRTTSCGSEVFLRTEYVKEVKDDPNDLSQYRHTYSLMTSRRYSEGGTYR